MLVSMYLVLDYHHENFSYSSTVDNSMSCSPMNAFVHTESRVVPDIRPILYPVSFAVYSAGLITGYPDKLLNK